MRCAAGGDIGGAPIGETYERRRRADIGKRTFAVDLFNRSLLTSLVPVHGLRGLALWLMQSAPPLRRAVMREGIGPTRDVPRLVAGRPRFRGTACAAACRAARHRAAR